nr:unnamed protein product [Spirometra erinaceieuropaei]
MSSTSSQEEQAIAMEAAETMGTQYSSPVSMVDADANTDIPKDNRLIRLRHSRQEGAWVLVKFDPCHVRAAHRGTFIDAPRQTGQSFHDVVQDGKDEALISSLCLGAAAPEYVICAHLLQLAFFQKKVSLSAAMYTL